MSEPIPSEDGSFAAIDARLGAMHGYAPMTDLGARLGRLEAKLDYLMKALEAGSVGRWSGLGPRP